MPWVPISPRAGVRGTRRPKLGRREILVRAGSIAVRARLFNTPAADRMWQALPIYATAQMSSGALAFETPVETGEGSGARQDIELGEITFCAFERRVLIACGPVNVSGLCDVWALALDDVRALAGVRSGDRVAVLEADS